MNRFFEHLLSLVLLAAMFGDAVMDRGLPDQGRRDRIDAYTGREIPGVGLGQANDASLGGAIERIHAADLTGHRCDVDDAARVRRLQLVTGEVPRQIDQ